MSVPITFFSCPKPFTSRATDATQHRAIHSWERIGAEIMLCGDDDGVLAAATIRHCKWAGKVETNEYGTPLLNSVFARAEAVAQTELVAFVNTDIILLDDFMPAVEACLVLPHFLMVGQRTDVDVPGDFRLGSRSFNSDIETLRIKALADGVRIGVGAADYFVYHKGDLGDIPPYAVGKFRWDNALMARAINRGMALVDATEAVLAVHQNHPPMPRVEGDAELHANDKLVGENEGWLGRLSDATHYLTADFELREQVKV